MTQGSILGFNEQMLVGITTLNQGLAEQQAAIAPQIPRQGDERAWQHYWEWYHCQQEARCDLLRHAERIDDPRLKRAITGLAEYCYGAGMIIGEKEGEEQHATILRLEEFFRTISKKFYDQEKGRPRDTYELISYINKQKRF
jgi:hypothetical protein